MRKRLSRRRLLKISAGLPFMSGLARGASAATQPQARVRLGDPAWPSEASWDQLDRDVGGRLIKVRSPLADCVGGSPDADLRAIVQGAQEPLLPRRRSRAHPVAWLGRGVDVGTERLRRRREDDARCRRRGQFRAHQQSAARGEGRRPQLPGNIQRRRLASHLDAPHERDHNARRLRRRRLRGSRGAATRRVDRAGRNLGTCL